MDWLKKITSLITSSQDSPVPHHNALDTLSPLQKLPCTLFEKNSSQSTKDKKAFHSTEKKLNSPKEEERKVSHKPDDDDDNLKALKRLRELPRGTQVDSRIGAIKSLLGEKEIFKTLKMLRWPQGVICPRCHSSNTLRRDPPPEATDKRHYYICLNCKDEGSPSGFDDFTGLPVGDMRALRQWVLCWYLIGFCSVAQIAKILGISIYEVMQIATLGNDLTLLPSEKTTLQATQDKDRKTQDRKRQQIEEQEDYTKSSSKAPLKPGYKSKK